MEDRGRAVRRRGREVARNRLIDTSDPGRMPGMTAGARFRASAINSDAFASTRAGVPATSGYFHHVSADTFKRLSAAKSLSSSDREREQALMLRNYPITRRRARAGVLDAGHPAPIGRQPRGARRFDGGRVVSWTARRGRPGRQLTDGRFESTRSRYDHATAQRRPRNGLVFPGSNICGAHA